MLVLLAFLDCIIFKTGQAQYFFKNAEDRDICRKAEFVEISPYRAVSLTQMSWQSAHACCKMKGKVLHTIEKSVESAQFPLQRVLPETFRVEAEDLQFWIGLSYHDENFQWSFGTIFPKSHIKIFREMYRWVEGQPEMTPGTRCVSISPYKEILELRTVPCNTKLNFICQQIPRIGGEPMTGEDFMIIGSAKFLEIPGFENLKFSPVYTRWPVANAICQSRNWVLIDRVHELYGDKLALVLAKQFYKLKETQKTFHSSGNDFCDPQKWQWACGEKLTGDIPWLPNAKRNNTHCLQYLVQYYDKFNSTLAANSVDCNEQSHVICDTSPSCSVNDQYRCLFNDPHFVDPEKELETDKALCKASKFNQLAAINRNNGTSYWVSSSKLTWMGANVCCKSRGWEATSPNSVDELKSLACENEDICDGFWTATSTLDYHPHSPLRFRNGKLLSRSLYSLIRGDGFSYPSCGRINFMDLQKSQAKYVHAHCLEKNFVVCEENNYQQSHNIVERRVLDEFDDDDFKQKLFDRFYDTPTAQELDRRKKDHARDVCLKRDLYKRYTENCPDSATAVDSTGSRPSNSKRAKIALIFQNQKVLLQQLITRAFYGSKNESGNMNEYAFQFLNYSVSLFSELCPNVPQSFLEKSFKLFRALYLFLNPKRRPEIITQLQFNLTMNFLGICKEQMKPVIIKYDNCGELVVAEKNCNNFVCTDGKFEFSLHKTDILLDILWKVLEGVHAVCFPAFKKNPILHSYFAMAIADLWNGQEMRFRWWNQIEKKGFWKRLLGPHFENHLLNIERCNAATIENSYFHVRLPRISLPQSMRFPGFFYKKIQPDESKSTLFFGFKY